MKILAKLFLNERSVRCPPLGSNFSFSDSPMAFAPDWPSARAPRGGTFRSRKPFSGSPKMTLSHRRECSNAGRALSLSGCSRARAAFERPRAIHAECSRRRSARSPDTAVRESPATCRIRPDQTHTTWPKRVPPIAAIAVIVLSELSQLAPFFSFVRACEIGAANASSG